MQMVFIDYYLLCKKGRYYYMYVLAYIFEKRNNGRINNMKT